MSTPSPYDHLRSVDHVLAGMIASYGTPDPFHWGWTTDRPGASAFRVLLLQIVSQHVPANRSFHIFDELECAAGEITPLRVLDLGTAGLLRVGLTERKAAAALTVARSLTDGSLDLDELPERDDDAVKRLTALPGIGPWSAQMFLLGCSHRPDVLPVDDYGIRHAIKIGWELDALPTPAAARRHGADWSPYRSYAAALLWTSELTHGDASQARDARTRPGQSGWLGKRTRRRDS